MATCIRLNQGLKIQYYAGTLDDFSNYISQTVILERVSLLEFLSTYVPFCISLLLQNCKLQITLLGNGVLLYFWGRHGNTQQLSTEILFAGVDFHKYKIRGTVLRAVFRAIWEPGLNCICWREDNVVIWKLQSLLQNDPTRINDIEAEEDVCAYLTRRPRCQDVAVTYCTGSLCRNLWVWTLSYPY